MNLNKKALETERLFSLMIPIWDCELIVSYTSDLDFLEKSLKDQPNWNSKTRKYFLKQAREIWKHRGQMGACYMYHAEKGYHWIHCFEKTDPGTFMNHMSHEVLHFVIGLLRSRGLRLNPGSEEIWTYLQGYVMQQIMEYMFRDQE